MVLVDRVVVPGNDCRQVGRHELGGGKGPLPVPISSARRVGDNHPIGGSLDAEVVGGFEVGLIEACEDPMRIIGGELAVKVDALVDRVLKPVQTGAVAE